MMGVIDRFLVILISLSAALLFPFLASLLKADFLNVFIFKLALTVTSKNTRQYQRKLFLFWYLMVVTVVGPLVPQLIGLLLFSNGRP